MTDSNTPTDVVPVATETVTTAPEPTTYALPADTSVVPTTEPVKTSVVTELETKVLEKAKELLSFVENLETESKTFVLTVLKHALVWTIAHLDKTQ